MGQLQGPIVDIVLLALLILFFGLQQRTRPQIYFRFWCVGWVFILMSYVVWEVKLTSPLAVAAQDAVRFDLMLVGVLIFLLSFLAREKALWTVVKRGLIVGLPVVALIDVKEFNVGVPRVVLLAAVIAWEACGIWAAGKLIPQGRIKTRLLVYLICGCFATGMAVFVWVTPGDSLADWALAEATLCSAVLYGGGLQRRSFAVYVGMAGFTAWSAFYFTDLKVIYQFWSFPKYFVGFAMILKVFEDANEEKETLAQELRALIAGYPYPTWIYESTTGQILTANLEAQRSYGYSEEEFQRVRVDDLEHKTTETIDELMAPLTEGRWTMHLPKSDRPIWVHLTERSVVFQGSNAKMLLARDVTDKVELNRQLSFRANHDTLTGLPNRALLADRIQQCFHRCEREERKATLLTIDIDHFKQINDTYGHPVGDECLRLVAARLASRIRQVDTLARVGGEEFMAIVGGLNRRGDATKVAESLLRVFDEPLRLGDLDLYVTVSIGVAIYPDDAVAIEPLTQRSDEALYAAKRNGRNCAFFASALANEMAAAAAE